MNPLIKANINLLIKQNKVVVNRHPGLDIFTIAGPDGKTLLEVWNGWDYGQYSISVGGKKIISVEYNANRDEHNKSQAQKDVLEIIKNLWDKITEQHQAEIEQEEAKKHMATMTADDRATYQLLTQALTKKK